MLKIELKLMLDMLSEGLHCKVTLAKVSTATGISRQTLSRIINEPEVPTTSDFIDKLILFFFHEFRDFLRAYPIEESPDAKYFAKIMGWDSKKYSLLSRSDKRLMEWIISEMIRVFPNEESYIDPVKNSVRGSLYGVSFSLLWSLYEKQTYPEE